MKKIKKTHVSKTYDANFIRLSEMAKNEYLDIKLILANPRTGSTLLETSFIQNKAIDIHLHEPFQGLNNTGDPQKGYKTILESLETRESFSQEPVTIIIKEISRGLSVNNEYERFLTLIKSPPILLIRNPFLSAESKIRIVLKGLSSRRSTSLQDVLLDYYSQTMGYGNTDALVHDGGVKDKVARQYKRVKVNSDTQQDKLQLKLQGLLLKYFAISKGYRDWNSMLEETFSSQNYIPFEEILIDERIYKLEPTSTLEMMHYFKSIGKSFIVVDITDYRLEPQEVVRILCRKWKIPFSNNMINWGQKGKKLHTGRTDLGVWFERVQDSAGIEQPYELSPVLSNFPKFIANYLKSVELPAYYEMSNSPNKARPMESLLQKNIDVPITKGNIRRLREVGLISLELNLVNENDLASVKLSILDLDPVFSSMSDPRYITNSKFLGMNARYLPTMKVIAKLHR